MMRITPHAHRLSLAAALVTAMLACASAAHADPAPPPGAPVPTAGQVAAISGQLTDPNVPDTDKAKLVSRSEREVEQVRRIDRVVEKAADPHDRDG
jgi:hypothetical protein